MATGLAAPGAAGPSSLTLAEGGKSGYRIVVSATAPPAARRGAQELQTYLEQMSGTRLPIVTDEGRLPAHAILVGSNRHLAALGITLDAHHLGPEGFLLRTAGPHLVIAGGGPRGTLYGCTSFLERLGVRWFTPKVTRVPHRATLEVAALDVVERPAFEYREPFFFEAQERDWAARLKINGFHTAVDESTGGKVSYYPFVHSFDELIPPGLFATHPEYFPLVGGVRKNGYVQRCLTNPDVLRLTIEKVRSWMQEHPEAMIYSVSQNDTYNFCECDNCKALTRKYGANSGLYLWFVNQVAEAIEKEHPDKLIDTLAYQFTEAAPTGITPRKNVRVRLCPIACCEAHPYEQCTAPPNVAFMKALRTWHQLAGSLYVWHYNTNFGHYLMPFPDFNEFPEEARLYLQSGVKGIFFQGAYAKGGGGSDAELRSYVMAKLLWDVNVDTDGLVTEWMQGVYGPAWKPMRQWFDLLHQQVRAPERHFFIYDSPTRVAYLSSEVVAEGDRLFDAAEKLAAGDATAADYVAKSRLWLRYVKLMQHPTTGPEFDTFMADVRRRGITQLREGQPLEAWEKAYRERAPK
jgi:hypothetical protein